MMVLQEQAWVLHVDGVRNLEAAILLFHRLQFLSLQISGTGFRKPPCSSGFAEIGDWAESGQEVAARPGG